MKRIVEDAAACPNDRFAETPGEWLDSSPLKFRLDENIAAILRAQVNDLSFWTEVLTPDAPIPITPEEHKLGFVRAIVIAAADGASARHREQWPEELKSIHGDQWCTSSCIPKAETARKLAAASLAEIAESLRVGGPASEPAETWESFVDLVALALNRKS